MAKFVFSWAAWIWIARQTQFHFLQTPFSVSLSNSKQPKLKIKKLRKNKVELEEKLLKRGSTLEVRGIHSSQADVEACFDVTPSALKHADQLPANWSRPDLLCHHLAASVRGGLGPFGLKVLASEDMVEYTAVYFRIFKVHASYAVLMCSDQSRSFTSQNPDKSAFGVFLNVDPLHLSLRILIDHSVVESFGDKGKACITARVYPTVAIGDLAHLYAFNHGDGQEVKLLSIHKG